MATLIVSESGVRRGSEAKGYVCGKCGRLHRKRPKVVPGPCMWCGFRAVLMLRAVIDCAGPNWKAKIPLDKNGWLTFFRNEEGHKAVLDRYEQRQQVKLLTFGR